MKYLWAWSVTVISALAASVLLGAVLGFWVQHISAEYLMIAWDVSYENLFYDNLAGAKWAGLKAMRCGLVSGALLGWAAICGRRKSAPWQTTLKGIGFAMAAASLAACGGGLLFYGLAKSVGPLLPGRVALQVGHPYRAMVSCGILYGAVFGAMAATIAVSIRLQKFR
jgi:hypothetical protein